MILLLQSPQTSEILGNVDFDTFFLPEHRTKNQTYSRSQPINLSFSAWSTAFKVKYKVWGRKGCILHGECFRSLFRCVLLPLICPYICFLNYKIKHNHKHTQQKKRQLIVKMEIIRCNWTRNVNKDGLYCFTNASGVINMLWEGLCFLQMLGIKESFLFLAASHFKNS